MSKINNIRQIQTAQKLYGKIFQELNKIKSDQMATKRLGRNVTIGLLILVMGILYVVGYLTVWNILALIIGTTVLLVIMALALWMVISHDE